MVPSIKLAEHNAWDAVLPPILDLRHIMSIRAFAFASLLLLWSGLVAGLTSTLQQVTNFGTNPTNVGMYVYKPTSVSSSPALIVAIHYCTGTAQAYFNGSPYAQLADPDQVFVTGSSSGGKSLSGKISDNLS